MTMRVLHEFPPDEVILSMAVFKGIVIIATTKGVYRISNEKLTRIEFQSVCESHKRGGYGAQQETNANVGSCPDHTGRGNF